MRQIRLREIPTKIIPLGLKGFLDDIRSYIRKIVDEQVTWDPGSIADGSTEERDVTIIDPTRTDKTYASLGDFVLASFSQDLNGLVVSASVKRRNVVTVTLLNNTGSAVDIGEGTLYVRVFRRE